MKTSSPNSITRLINATGFSLQGLRAAFIHEQAFRLEVYLLIILIPLALYLGSSTLDHALMIGSWLLVMIVELINSAIEAVVDRFGGEQHELSGRAKDIGSAAVMVAVALSIVIWVGVLTA